MWYIGFINKDNRKQTSYYLNDIFKIDSFKHNEDFQYICKFDFIGDAIEMAAQLIQLVKESPKLFPKDNILPKVFRYDLSTN